MPVEPQKPYISSKEAAKKFGLTNDHIGLLCRRGKINGLLWGRVWYVSEPSLEDYVKKNIALKEERRKALSKQWHAAWTAVFVGLLVFGMNAQSVSADYVTPSPRLKPVPNTLEVSVASISDSVHQFEENAPMPDLPVLAPLPPRDSSDSLFFANLREGLLFVGESVAMVVDAAPAAPAVRVTYAVNYVPEVAPPSAFVAPHMARDSRSFTNGIALAASAFLTQVPAPDFSYAPAKGEIFLTAENLLAGTIAANELLDNANDALFSTYAQSVAGLARYAQFDLDQAAFVFDQIFGEFGRQYVHDLSALNDLQIRAYFSAGALVLRGYNTLADQVDRIQPFDSSISVASASYASPALGAAVGDAIAGIWNGTANFFSGFFAAVAGRSDSTDAIVPVSTPVPEKAAATKNSNEMFAVAPTQPPAIAVPLPAVSSARIAVAQPSSFASTLVTQDSLNDQLTAWMQVVRALVAGQGSQNGYVDNPAVAALGSGGGGSVVNNYYGYSQRIDKLDGVTITNSSINGVSSFNAVSALTDLSDTLVASPAYGDLLMYNGSKWVNTATSSLGISGGSASLTGSSGQVAYFSGANTAVGTSSIYISSAGSVGIGTASPYSGTKLTLAGGGLAVWGNSGGQGVLIDMSGGGHGYVSGVNLTLDSNGSGDVLRVRDGSFNTIVSIDSAGKLVLPNAANALKLPALGTAAGAFLAADPNGFVIATTTPSGGSASLSGSTGQIAYFSGSNTAVGTSSLYITPAGNVGVGTTSPYAKVTVWGGSSTNGNALEVTNSASTSILTVSNAGVVSVGANGSNAFTVDAATGSTTISNLSIGNLNFDTNAGVVALSNIPVDSSAAAGVIESQSINIGDTNVLTVYGESDGSGGVQNLRVGIGTTSPYAALSVAGTVVANIFNATSSATSTFAGAIRATCFSTDGSTCISGGASNLYASTTIGAGTQITGLTVSGGATTTGNLYVSGSISSASSLRTSGGVYVGGSSGFLQWGDTGIAGSITGALGIVSNGVFRFLDSSGGGSPRIILGSNSAQWVSLKRNGASLDIRLGDDSGYASTTAAFFIANSSSRASTFPYASTTAISATGAAYLATSGGSVGVGTTSPYARLSVKGIGIGTTANFQITDSQNAPLVTSFDDGSFGIGSSTPWAHVAVSGLLSTSPFPAFVVSNTSAALFTVQANGYTGIGTTSPGGMLTIDNHTVDGSGASLLSVTTASGYGLAVSNNRQVYIDGTPGVDRIFDSALHIKFNSSSGYTAIENIPNSDSATYQRFFNGSLSAIGSITENGTSGVAFNTVSDRRIKENIATTTRGLDTLMQLPVDDFSFIADPAHATTTGFIAQELFKVFPWAVTTNGDDGMVALSPTSTPWAVDYGRVTPLIVKAVQDVANITSTFKNNLIAWLADASNGITKLFAKEVHTDKLCVGDTCVTQEQFLAMVAASTAQASAPAAAIPAGIEDASSTPPLPDEAPATDASSTPPVEETPPPTEDNVATSIQ